MGAAPRCPEVKKVLQYQWDSGSIAELSGTGSAKEAGRKLTGNKNNRPTIVLLRGNTKKEEADYKRMETALKNDERLALGARFFRMVKMDGTSIGRRGPAAKLLGGSKLPRLVLVGMGGKYVKKFERKISATRLFSSMNKVASKDAGVRLERIVKYVRKHFNEIDGVYNQKNALSQRKQKNGDRNGKLAKEIKKLDTQLGKLKEQVKKLLTPIEKKAKTKQRSKR